MGKSTCGHIWTRTNPQHPIKIPGHSTLACRHSVVKGRDRGLLGPTGCCISKGSIEIPCLKEIKQIGREQDT